MDLNSLIDIVADLPPVQQAYLHMVLEKIMDMPDELRSQNQRHRALWIMSPQPVVEPKYNDVWEKSFNR